MKIKVLLPTLFAGFLFAINISAQQPTLEWAKSMGGTSEDKGNSITTDANGNVYTTGYFENTVDFDPGADTFNLASNKRKDIFIQKLDSSGSFLWVKQMGGKGRDIGVSITTDVSGNIYTTGYFEDTVDFDPGAGVTQLISEEHSPNIFIQKLDVNGNFLWAKAMGGTSWDQGHSITTDARGNVFSVGAFSDTVDFDPGSGTANLISAGGYDIYIQKLDANGNFLWVKQIGGTEDEYSNSITTDAGGNVYTTGYFRFTVDFDPGVDTTNLTSAGLYDFFIQKLDSDGNFIWVKQMGGTGIDAGIGITLDAIGNVYTTGYFSDTVDFNPGSGTAFLTCTGLYDTFVQKLDANGNFIWAKQTSSTDWAYGFSITTDANGDVYTMGIFSDTVDFDPGPGTTILIASQNVEVFIQKLDVNGNFIWATQTTGNSEDSDISGSSITTDNYGNVYTTGYFEGTRDFDPGTGTINLTSKGSSDVFIQKLSQTATVGITEYTFTENIQVYPNPTSGNFAIKFETIQKDLSVRIVSISGQIVETRTFQNTDFVQLKLEQPNGFYLVEIQNEKGNKTVSRLIKK